MKSLEQLDSWIGSKVRNWSVRASRGQNSRELLEIRRDILLELRDNIQPKGQGKKVFPYDTVSVLIASPDAGQQALLQSAFAQDKELEQDVRALLEEANCPIPANFNVVVSVIEEPAMAAAASPFQIEYSNAPKAEIVAQAVTGRPNARLAVIRGQADAAEYTIASDRVNIGRLKEVVGDRDGLRRRNDIAFSETETSVSREHAYIRYDTSTCKFRLYDSMSQRGTSVFRDGRRVEVPKGPLRGVQLRSGDEIHLGEARILFQITDA